MKRHSNFLGCRRPKAPVLADMDPDPTQPLGSASAPSPLSQHPLSGLSHSRPTLLTSAPCIRAGSLSPSLNSFSQSVYFCSVFLKLTRPSCIFISITVFIIPHYDVSLLHLPSCCELLEKRVHASLAIPGSWPIVVSHCILLNKGLH